MDNNEPSREAKAIIDYYERQREKGLLPPQTPGNGFAHPEWDSDNRNVIRARTITSDAEELFDEEGYYIGTGIY